jgi:cytoskeleton protein RodZ
MSKFLKLTNLTQAATAPVAAIEGASKGATAADAPSLGAVTIVPFEPVPPVATPPSALPSSPVAQINTPAVAQPDPAKVPLAASKTGAPEWVFTATAESWLEVRDGQNQVLWSGILKPGESSRLQAPLPVSVVVGRADALQVRFKGQAFDLTPHSKMNVARFEVKP